LEIKIKNPENKGQNGRGDEVMLLKKTLQFAALSAVLLMACLGCVAGYVAGYDQYGRPVIMEPVYVPAPVYVPPPVVYVPFPYYYTYTPPPYYYAPPYYGYRHHRHHR